MNEGKNAASKHMHEARRWLKISTNILSGGISNPPENDEWLQFNAEFRKFVDSRESRIHKLQAELNKIKLRNKRSRGEGQEGRLNIRRSGPRLGCLDTMGGKVECQKESS